MSKDAMDSTTPKKTDDNKVEQPWSDKERSLIVNHVLTHVLASVGYGNIFSELPDMLAKEGFPPRTKQACKDQWRRKICKELLSIYGGKQPTSTPASPAKAAAGPSKAPASPSKRKRKEE